MTHAQSATPSSDRHPPIRYAVVGLGWFAQSAILPAFTHAENAELAALVSDDPVKLAEIAQAYSSVQRTFSYEEYDDLLSSGLIDAVYIALPNHLHCSYTVRAAAAGIHVLCEKPMAMTVDECETMIRVATENQIKLMIAYRLHLEKGNLQAIETVQSGQIGEPRLFNSLFTQQTQGDNIRLDREKGGGTLEDIGIYCINAARYLFQAEPIAVFATQASKAEPRFQEVAEMTSAILRFPSVSSADDAAERLATFTCSFGAAKVSTYQIVGTQGDLRVDPAYTWHGDITHHLTVEGETQEHVIEQHDQLAAELVYFSDCIVHDRDPEPSGREGLIDVQIIHALKRSLETGQFVSLDLPNRHQRPTTEQAIDRPSQAAQPDLIHVTSPSDKSK